ncbi:MAG TPA: transposase [Thermotogota bacterium]|nr:transposase [Thermotogota bacterium]HPG99182.1 transposase [Thermotogota bacterium]
MEDPRWHSRGYLPHFDGERAIQMVTIRLTDALPANVIEDIRRIVEAEKELSKDTRIRKKIVMIEKFADKGYGNCLFARKENALIVKGTLLKNGHKIFAWVIMPNHIHFLIKVKEDNTLSSFIKDFKQKTTREINLRENTSGRIWQKEYYDRYIRDEKHFSIAKAYIQSNPIKAGLVTDISKWEWYGEM